jgi:hypothetical protein
MVLLGLFLFFSFISYSPQNEQLCSVILASMMCYLAQKQGKEKQPWTETSETMRQKKFILFLKLLISGVLLTVKEDD